MAFDLTNQGKQRGDIAIYTALIVVTIMLSGALAMSTILSRQIPATAELLNTERAFYAVQSGREAAFFVVAKQHVFTDFGYSFPVNEVLKYSAGDEATYASVGDLTALRGPRLCGTIEGVYGQLKRRLEFSTPAVNCPL